MEFSAEEFQHDEVWLAEKIFSQLKEFNSDDQTTSQKDDISNNNNNLTTSTDSNSSNEKILDLSLVPTPTDTKLSNNSEKFEDNTNILFELDNLKQEINNNDNKLLMKMENINQQISQIHVNDENTISPEHLENSYEGNNRREVIISEKKGCYEIAMSLPQDIYPESIMSINDIIPNSGICGQQTPIIKCMNCDQIFDDNAFKQHICDYDSSQNLIILDKDEEYPNNIDNVYPKTIEQKVILEKLTEFLIEPPCVRQLRENNGRIRKFLKDELKIDLGGPAAKKDGPHECTLCERKFVHASGLARHMEKHAMDLIPSTNSNLTENKTRLRVVVKCLVCGRIFFVAKEALAHLFEKHEKPSDNDNNNNINNNNNKSNNNVNTDELDVSTDDEQDPPSESMIKAAIEFIDKKNIDLKPENNDIAKENPFLKVIILSCILQCEFCDYMFADAANLLLHSCTHNPLRGFECFGCEIYVSTSKEMFLHWQAECPFSRELFRKNCNLQKYYVCNVCENKFTTLEQLFDHRYSSLHLFPRFNQNLNIMQICCEYCGTIYDTAADILRHHEEKHFKKLPKKENTPATTTTTPSAIKYRQYLCDVCGKSYTQSSHLWQHLRFHRGVKPFACKEPGCNRRFTIRPDLNDHIRKCHTGERPYHCLVCGKRFLTGSVFYQHRLIHRGERRYGCEECGKRFYRADALKNHQRIHTGEKPYACMYCSKNFRQRGDRDKHIRARHSNLDENARNILASMKNAGGMVSGGTGPINKTIPPPILPQQPPGFQSITQGRSLGLIENDGVVFVGNVPFPASMFKPMISDIDDVGPN